MIDPIRLCTIGALVVIPALFVFSAVSRLRKRLGTDAKPTVYTYLNELGGYVFVAILVIVGGLFALLQG